MSLIDTPNLSTLEHFLNIASYRQSLVASNLANIDTPGYRTRDIDFRSEMKRAAQEPEDQMEEPIARQVPGLMERPDGNNVSIDRETMLLGQTQLKFRTAIALLRAEFQNLTTAIKEGSAV
jgi:flagellar basal-body rod protein FlgB